MAAARVYLTFQKLLATLLLLLASLLVSQNSQQKLSSGLVRANVVNASSSLPALSERANSGLNSRYLSAAGTASLAAATVAASSNNQPAQSQNQIQNQNQSPSQANSNNQLEASRNFLQHQQQHQQQQQQQQHTQPAGQQQQQVPVLQQAGPQAATSGPTVPQFNNAQLTSTPLMSTTYTFNPLLNQFVPSELSTSSIVTPNFPPTGSYGFQQNYNQYAAQQQQQQQNRFGLSGYQSGYPSPSLNQIINQQRQLNRRNGYSANPTRFGGSLNNFGQTIDDDGYFLQQQQQATAELANSNFNPLNEYAFGQPTSGGYNPYSEHQISPQPSSVSSSIVPAQQQQSSSFSTAFSGPPPVLGFEQKNDQCVAADGRHGTCYQASECIKKNGTPMGKCNGSPNSNEFSGSSYVCCLFDVTCGSFAAERFVYFRNPNYPNTFDQSQRMCRTRIGKLDKGICQFRLDLNRFDVAKPTNGNCSTDMFVVSGQNENYIIPKICGLNDGQHYYVGVDESGIITLHMMMMGFYRRNFEILITQIPCRSDYSAPAHCLQYYMGTHGTIKSFNYNDDELHSGAGQQPQSNNYDLLPQAADQLINQQLASGFLSTAPYGLQLQQQQQSSSPGQLQQRQMFANRFAGPSQVVYASNPDGYPNDLDYTMCIRKESGFCSITYQLSRSEQGVQPFAIGHSLFANDSAAFGTSGWHPVSTECRDDYLLIGGVRLCSGSNVNQYPSNFDPAASGSSQLSTIQFSQNGSILNAAGITGNNNLQIQQQQLQNQYNLLLQQLARLQQQQQLTPTGNNSTGQQTTNANQLAGQNNGNNNLDQQQAAIIQQTLLIQQQLNQLANQQQQNNRYQQQFEPIASQSNNNQQQFSQDALQGAIITDTTPGPFILRFVSNLARNARGFHIDYRQNPCK